MKKKVYQKRNIPVDLWAEKWVELCLEQVQYQQKQKNQNEKRKKAAI